MSRRRSIALYWGIRDYVKHCQEKQLAPNTLRWYSQKLQLFRVYMAQVHHIASAGSITYTHVQGYLAALRQERQMSDATIKGHLKALQAFFTWTTTQGYTLHNPARLAASLQRFRY